MNELQQDGEEQVAVRPGSSGRDAGMQEMDFIGQVFGPGGFLAIGHGRYEDRPTQVALARKIDLAMREGKHLLAEGATGVGKSMAYGVPAVFHATRQGKRAVIVTSNISLQEQLCSKDLPFLAKVLPWPFTFALLKGRNNYLCLDRVAESNARGELTGIIGDGVDAQIAQVSVWADKTTTGDVSELPFVPVPAVWSRFSVGSEDCKGKGCSFREKCFAERARAAAEDADVIVANAHLLAAHVSVRRETGMDFVLPEFDLLVIDEAHEIADIARDFFGFTITEFSVAKLARYAESLGKKPLAIALRSEAADFFGQVAAFARSGRYKCRLKTADFASPVKLRKCLGELAALAGSIGEDEREEVEARAKARNARRQAETLSSRLSEAVSLSDPEKVYWIDLDKNGRAKLGAKPIDVAPLLREELFERTESVTMVSATMTTGGTFDFIRSEVGAPADTMEVIAESPFDFAKQALLVVPDGIPDPRDPGFIDAASEAFQRVIDACDGRTLGLFTSYRNLNAVYERVGHNGHRVLKQGDLPRTELTRIFKEDIGSVLLGTESFWTGIDVPGEALTGLVIDKLPFPNMDDPVVDAVCERDRRAFDNYLLPRAIILLRQGVGRLIRSQSDIGVAVILDSRIAEKGYGRRILRSLPPMLTTRKLSNITRFLAEAADARAS